MMNSPVQDFHGKMLANVGKLFNTLRSPIAWLRAIFSFLRKG